MDRYGILFSVLFYTYKGYVLPHVLIWHIYILYI